MAINRTNQPIYLRQAYGPGAYAISGGYISTFTATGSMPNDSVGATYRVHKFTNVGTQTITFAKAGFIDVLLVAGGGSGGHAVNNGFGGGGGAGGILETYNYGVDIGSYSITVPSGGIQMPSSDPHSAIFQGGNAVFHSLIAFGGGAGGSGPYARSGMNGGCGGGSNGNNTIYSNFGPGSGITNQGFSGGNATGGATGVSGGGGGAGGPGGTTTSSAVRGDGGIGRLVAFDGNVAQYYSGGGQGGNIQGFSGGGGLGGGGNHSGIQNASGGNASFYGGGGAGATSNNASVYSVGGSGFQGLVIIRYRIS